MRNREEFKAQLKEFVNGLQEHISTDDGQWTIKGFIDVFQNIYTISSDTKIVSKILEIHLFPKIMNFARQHGYKLVLAEHQNYYPDISFVKADDETIKFAVDFKTTYRIPDKPFLCNGFTLGSHGKYFQDRNSTKNIQFPYSSYSGHFCLGIIYNRVDGSTIDETKPYKLSELTSISSVVRDFRLFVAEKWLIASDKSGSGNTANIGSINNIKDLINENGMFSKLGEHWFDDYWMNYGKITIQDRKGNTKKLTDLESFVRYKKGNVALIVPKHNKYRDS
ncbi:EcoRV family type II restriction endonuclease [Candidatus Marithrix sp. Canyon 246]|uniref:EcoRV family type II restriction endonuclease n=1 Tax=Candidatus Marithrix sp. Canyon 246 TaxID=1827136 RepID=UPI00084A0C2C|nr:EcoRV family type II restriction endonuclease [Candidatus Marithrix sp. Canyon 246]